MINRSHPEVESALDHLFSQPDPDFVDRLEQRLRKQIEGQPSAQSGVRRRSVRYLTAITNPNRHWRSIAIGIAVLILITASVFAVGPNRVWAALQGLLGYIPGVGFVKDSETLRILSAPVQQSKDGITVTVDEAVVDSEATYIKYHVDGIPNARKLAETGQGEDKGPFGLRLPDGTLVKMKGGEVLFTGGISGSYTFEPLPDGVSEVTFFFQHIPWMPTGKLPEDWSFDLPFIPGSQSNRLIAATPEGYIGQTGKGISLAIESLAQLEEKTAIKVRLNVNPELGQPEGDWPTAVYIMDAEGHVSPILHGHGNSLAFELSDRTAFTTEIESLIPGKSYSMVLPGPIQLIQPVDASPETQFTFDPGPNPKVGQSWKLDKSIQAGKNRLHLTGVRLYYNLFEAGDRYELLFEFEKPEGVNGITVSPVGSSPIGQPNTLGEAQTDTRGPLQAWVMLQDMPEGPMQFKVSQLIIPYYGEWQVSWTEP